MGFCVPSIGLLGQYSIISLHVDVANRRFSVGFFL